MKITSVQFLCPVKICVESESGDKIFYNANMDFVNQTVDGVSPEIAKQALAFITQSPNLKMPDVSVQFDSIKAGLGNRTQSFVKDIDAKSEFKSSKHTNQNA